MAPAGGDGGDDSKVAQMADAGRVRGHQRNVFRPEPADAAAP